MGDGGRSGRPPGVGHCVLSENYGSQSTATTSATQIGSEPRAAAPTLSVKGDYLRRAAWFKIDFSG